MGSDAANGGKAGGQRPDFPDPATAAGTLGHAQIMRTGATLVDGYGWDDVSHGITVYDTVAARH